MAHTPGPWKVERQWSNGCENCPRIYSADDTWVAEAVGAPYVVGPEPTMSNATLIAAAPDLLAACQEALDILDSAEVESLRLRGVKPTVKRMRAVIATATKGADSK